MPISSLDSRYSFEALSFLKGKSVFHVQENCSFIQLFGFEGKPFMLPIYVFDKFFLYKYDENIGTQPIYLTRRGRKNLYYHL